MTIVDSSVWVDFLNARSTEHAWWLRKNIHRINVGLTELVLAESLQGIRDDALFRKTRSLFANFPVLQSSNHELALLSADHYRWLRKRGITIRTTIDCLTATMCIAEGYDLLHNDRDFDPFEKHLGLKVVHPEAV